MLRCYHQFHLSTSNEETSRLARPSLTFFNFSSRIFFICDVADDEVITSLITFDNQQHEKSAAAAELLSCFHTEWRITVDDETMVRCTICSLFKRKTDDETNRLSSFVA